MAASSLITMICLWQIDRIVHGTLYEYGLTFNLQWATQYWTFARFAFAMGWINIVAAIAVQLYSVAFRQKEVEDLVNDVQKEIHKQWTTATKKTEDQKTPQITEQPQKTETQKPPQPEPQPAPPTEQKETPPQPQPQSQPPEKKEETPILAGVTQEEIPPPPEKTPQQVAPAAS